MSHGGGRITARRYLVALAAERLTTAPPAGDGWQFRERNASVVVGVAHFPLASTLSFNEIGDS